MVAGTGRNAQVGDLMTGRDAGHERLRAVAAGVDREAMRLEPPLLFETRPATLRVRIPRHGPGLSPGALGEVPIARRLAALARIAAGRPT
jgi:hypothetical protein